MTSTLVKSPKYVSRILSKTILATVFTTAFAGLSATAMADGGCPRYLECIEQARDKLNEGLTPCQDRRIKDDDACEANFPRGSEGDRNCRMAANRDQEDCNRPHYEQYDKDLRGCYEECHS
jgi:hypothetical protein